MQNQSDEDDEEIDEVLKKSRTMTAPEYKRIIAIHAGNAKKGLRHTLRNGSNKVSRLSLSEQRLEKAAELYATDLIRCSYFSFFILLLIMLHYAIL